MFDTLIVQPIFNLLVFIYAIIPGHNFGLAIILFTIVIRLLMWPLVKKQLHHAKAIRELQPEMKKIKQQAAGDKRKQQILMAELYKEREINPLASVGIIFLQAIILLGLYFGLRNAINDPEYLINASYDPLHHLPWMKTLAEDINNFDGTFLGFIDLTRTAVNPLYWPAMLLVIGSAISQFFQGRMLMPKPEDSRSLRQILREAGQGKETEQHEVNAAVGRSTLYIMPAFIIILTINLPAALPLYWLTGSLAGIWQQHRILREDVKEAEVVANKSDAKAQTGALKKETKAKKPNSKKTKRRKRRR